MTEKDQQNRGNSKKKHSPLTDFFRDALVPNQPMKQFAALHTKIENELEAVLNILRLNLPPEIYQEYFDLADRYGEYEVCLDTLCNWIDENNMPITRDVFDRLQAIGDLMQLERDGFWEVLQIHVKD